MSGTIEATPQEAAIAVRGRPLAWPRWTCLMAALSPLVLGPGWIAIAPVFGTATVLATLAGSVLVSLLLACAFADLEWRKIPNWATYTAAGWALLINAAGSLARSRAVPVPWLGAIGIGECLLGFGACFLIMLLIYRAAGSGAGDVKLAAAIGALLGPERGLNALVFTYIAAGVAIAAWAIWTVGPIQLFGGLVRRVGSRLFPGWIARPTTSQERLFRKPVPLGVFFGIGTLVALSGVGLR